MSTAAVSMVKDEADVLPATLEAMAAEVDFLVVADNGSTDGTRELLEQLQSSMPLVVLDDPEVGYFQSAKMSHLAGVAAALGAEWVVPFDADERWYSPFGPIADVLAAHPGAAIAPAELFDHVPTAADEGPTPLEAMIWRRREAAPLPKVACRPTAAVRIHQGNHGADYGSTIGGLLVVRHFPYRSPEQFLRKVRNGAAAYAATDLPETDGAHWRQYGAILDKRGPEVLLEEVFRRYFWSEDPEADETLIRDPCP